MTMTTFLSPVFLGLFAAPLFVAAIWDAWKFRIPNLLTALLAISFVPAALAAEMMPGGSVAWGWHLGAGAAVLVVGAVLFARGWMGGGDVKLAAACALWMGPLTPSFLVVVTMAGGLVALVLLVLRRVLPPMLAALPITPPRMPRALVPGEAVPYGIAIAGGGLILARQVPLLSL